MSKQGGFTLLQLLTAVVIVMVIGALLFPLFAKSRSRNPRYASCMSNLKNSAMVLRMYSSDFDERLPPDPPQGGYENKLGPGRSKCASTATCWPHAAAAYIKNDYILLCPRWDRVNLVRCKQPGCRSDFWPTTYVLSQPLIGARESEISNAANKVMLFEAVPYHTDSMVNAKCGQRENYHRLDCNGTKRGMILIVAFVDGHMKVVNMNQSLGPDLNATCVTSGRPRNKWNLHAGWNPDHPTACGGDANPSPWGASGRAGANF